MADILNQVTFSDATVAKSFNEAIKSIETVLEGLSPSERDAVLNALIDRLYGMVDELTPKPHPEVEE